MGCVSGAGKLKAAAAVAAAAVETMRALGAAAVAAAARVPSSLSFSSSASSSSAAVVGAARGLGAAAASARGTAPPPARVVDLCDVALSGEDARKYKTAITSSPLDEPPKIAGLHRNRASINRLQPDVHPCVHLNDDCINDFLFLACIESDRWPQSPSVYVAQSLLLPFLRSGGNDNARVVSKLCVNAKGPRRLFDVDLVVVPVHDPARNHWYLVVACLRGSPVFSLGFTIFDSLPCAASLVTPILDLLRLYLVGEFERMRVDLPDCGVESAGVAQCPDWLQLPIDGVHIEKGIMPTQVQDDCGVFTLRAGLAVLLGLQPVPVNTALHRFDPKL